MASQLSFEFNVDITRNSVIGKCKRLKLDISYNSNNKKFWTTERLEELCGMVDCGMTYKAIGEHFGRSDRSIRNKCEYIGISNGLTNKDAKKVNKDNLFRERMERKERLAKERAAWFKENDMVKMNERKQANKHKPVIYKIDHDIRYHNPEPRKLTLMQLEHNQCHFPVGHPKDGTLRYCGADIPHGSIRPYCEHCHAVMYIPSKYSSATKAYRQ
jgi:hypothetical protein